MAEKKKKAEKAEKTIEEKDLNAENYNENWVSKSSKFDKAIHKAQYYFKNQDKLNELITKAYNKATNEKGNRTITEMWGKLTLLFRMIRSHFRKEYSGTSTVKIVLGIAVILYFVLPIDLLPDFIPLAGYIDDASLLAWFIKNSATEIDKFKQWESENVEAAPAF